MADKLSTGTFSGMRMQDTVAPENRQPALQYSKDVIGTLLQSAPVPVEFKHSVQSVMPDSRLSPFASADAFTAGSDPGPQPPAFEMALNREPAGLFATMEKSTQPFYLTDAMVNLTLLEHSAAGLQKFDARPLSALITNTYFFEACLYPQIYWCPCLSDPAKAISKECIDLWRKAIKTVEDKGELTAAEYSALIKKCPEFAILFYRVVEDNTYKPKTKNLVNIEAFKKVEKKADEDVKKKQKEADDARKKEQQAYEKSHGGKAHSPCECWELIGYAAYTDGTKIPITGKSAGTPTKIPKQNLSYVSGQGKEVKGPHEFKSLRDQPNCCTFEFLSKYVQVAHTLPKGVGVQPKYTGITHDMDRSNALSEYDYWITLTSTPNNYGWDFANGIGRFRCNKKRESEVQQFFGKLMPLNKGLGKIEINIDGKNCPSKTLWYEVV